MVQRSLDALLTALRTKQRPIQFCVYRLNLRKGRLPTSAKADSFHAALEAERKRLEDAKTVLVVRQTQTVGMLQQLKDCANVLEADLTKKNAAQKIDRDCLKEQSDPLSMPMGGVQGALGFGEGSRNPRPRSADARAPFRKPFAESGESSVSVYSEGARKNEQNRIAQTLHIIAAAEKGLEPDAQKLCKANAEVMEKTDRDCKEAFERSQARMRERINTLEAARIKLTKEIVQCSGKIDQTRQNMLLISAGLAQHQIPLDSAGQALKLRETRDPAEDIRDEVAVGLENSRRKMEDNMLQLKEEHLRTSKALDALEETRRGLETQLRDTNVALQTDLQCRQASSYAY
jgi:hypothetical protein